MQKIDLTILRFPVKMPQKQFGIIYDTSIYLHCSMCRYENDDGKYNKQKHMKNPFHTLTLALLMVATSLMAVQPAIGQKDPDKPIHLTKAEFVKKVMDYQKNPNEWIYKGDKPAIIDFYADWCAPCKKVAPALDELAKEYAGKVYIYKIDIDKEKELANLFGIRNIPTYLIIPMEGKPQMTNGASSNHAENKKRFKQVIDEVLLK